MDYTEFVEKVLSYLKFNLEFEELEKILVLKRSFNNDLNLIGCFLKDYLILKNNNENFEDCELYNKFVLFFEKNKSNKMKILNDIIKFSKYYLMIVFEKSENIEFLSIFSTINLCCCLDCYPLMMKILDDYFEMRINEITAYKMFQSILNVVLDRFESPDDYDIDFYNVIIDKNGSIYSKNKTLERNAV